MEENNLQEAGQETAVDTNPRVYEPGQIPQQEPAPESQLETVEAETTEPQEEVVQEVQQEEPQEQPQEEMIVKLEETPEESPVESPLAEDLPENTETPSGTGIDWIDKLVEFHKETGGGIKDYMLINQNFDDFEGEDLVREYYKSKHPYLDDEEIALEMEDKFQYDEELDDPKDIKRKQLELKKEVYNAKTFLKDKQEKYLVDMKQSQADSSVNKEAIEFYNNYQKQTEETSKARQEFEQGTNKFFSDEWKGGFVYNIGNDKFLYKVSDSESIMNDQMDINGFISDFIKDGKVDQQMYHKAIHLARNADKVTTHFYNQGVADAMKKRAEKTNNVNMTAQTSTPSPNNRPAARVVWDPLNPNN